LSEIEDPGFNKDLLSQFEFEKQADGSYSFYWRHPAITSTAVSMPRKLADLTSPKWAFYQAMKVELISEALSEASSLIPLPVVSGLLQTAVDRFFHFYALLRHTNQNMVLEMLNSVQDGSGVFSATPIKSNEDNAATESLVFSQTSLLTSYKWIWGKPLSDWKNGLNQQAAYEAQSAKWLASQGLIPVNLNTRFAFNGSANPAEKALLLMARQKPNKKTGPTVAVNYGNPTKIRNERILLEAGTSALVFASTFFTLPGVGAVVKDVYKYFVENPVDATKTWEGRLTAHLEARAAALHEDYSAELAVLDDQRVNPLFGSRSAMVQLIRQRKALLGLP